MSDNDPLLDAIIAAGDELDKVGWCVWEDGVAANDSPFVQTIHRHVLPIMTNWREHRIAALRAELEMLEKATGP